MSTLGYWKTMYKNDPTLRVAKDDHEKEVIHMLLELSGFISSKYKIDRNEINKGGVRMYIKFTGLPYTVEDICSTTYIWVDKDVFDKSIDKSIDKDTSSLRKSSKSKKNCPSSKASKKRSKKTSKKTKSSHKESRKRTFDQSRNRLDNESANNISFEGQDILNESSNNDINAIGDEGTNRVSIENPNKRRNIPPPRNLQLQNAPPQFAREERQREFNQFTTDFNNDVALTKKIDTIVTDRLKEQGDTFFKALKEQNEVYAQQLNKYQEMSEKRNEILVNNMGNIASALSGIVHRLMGNINVGEGINVNPIQIFPLNQQQQQPQSISLYQQPNLPPQTVNIPQNQQVNVPQFQPASILSMPTISELHATVDAQVQLAIRSPIEEERDTNIQAANDILIHPEPVTQTLIQTHPLTQEQQPIIPISNDILPPRTTPDLLTQLPEVSNNVSMDTLGSVNSIDISLSNINITRNSVPEEQASVTEEIEILHSVPKGYKDWEEYSRSDIYINIVKKIIGDKPKNVYHRLILKNIENKKCGPPSNWEIKVCNNII
jgi:hypothetical protein